MIEELVTRQVLEGDDNEDEAGALGAGDSYLLH